MVSGRAGGGVLGPDLREDERTQGLTVAKPGGPRLLARLPEKIQDPPPGDAPFSLSLDLGKVTRNRVGRAK